MEISCEIKKVEQLRVWWGMAIGSGYGGSEAQCNAKGRGEPGNGRQKQQEGIHAVRRSMANRSVTEEDRRDT